MTQSRDSSFTYVHLHSPHHVDLLEDFTRLPRPTTASTTTTSSSFATNPSTSSRGRLLLSEDIYVEARHQPVNSDEEDDVVPEQHAAFGIQRATLRALGRETAWRDLGVEGLMGGGPPVGGGRGVQGVGRGTVVTLR
ncbi:hypothetical protein B0A54_06348 [Friedmanniomyces endolithicus]|uniref:Uncharacterized protein n=1 Tax=Friedmanniomyces endolithicus TaxID=329885 RepID=A0A4U0V1G5_9PEZI|nr:hypothetical protein B0A54_06348 [Friedmanniomyces endolithicus]